MSSDDLEPSTVRRSIGSLTSLSLPTTAVGFSLASVMQNKVESVKINHSETAKNTDPEGKWDSLMARFLESKTLHCGMEVEVMACSRCV